MIVGPLHRDSLEQLMLAYKRGAVSREAVRAKLITKFGVSPSVAEQAIQETDIMPLAMVEKHVGAPAEASAVTYERCAMCNGTKVVPFKVPGQMMQCPRCKGLGYVSVRIAL